MQVNPAEHPTLRKAIARVVQVRCLAYILVIHRLVILYRSEDHWVSSRELPYEYRAKLHLLRLDGRCTRDF